MFKAEDMEHTKGGSEMQKELRTSQAFQADSSEMEVGRLERRVGKGWRSRGGSSQSGEFKGPLRVRWR